MTLFGGTSDGQIVHLNTDVGGKAVSLAQAHASRVEFLLSDSVRNVLITGGLGVFLHLYLNIYSHLKKYIAQQQTNNEKQI